MPAPAPTPVTPAARARRAVALAGGALLAGALLAGAAGCTGHAYTVSEDGVEKLVVSDAGITVSDGSGQATIELSGGETRSVTVSGTATREVAPDRATVSFGIVVIEDSSDAAQASVAATLEDVRAGLAALGVDDAALATDRVNIYPQYDYSQSVETIAGYEATLRFTVSDVAVEQAGSVIAAATAAGATNAYGISYSCSAYDQEYRAALDDALALARGKAASLAAASGDAVGAVLSLSEGYEDQSYRATTEDAAYEVADASGAVMAAEDAGSASSGIAIDPGTVQISASVTATFELMQE
jgi:uncharacterized protein YggE